tara:strand:+ start:1624 stop:2169 length:546 start_codon:yes stop_codon:yes gene_type:complete
MEIGTFINAKLQHGDSEGNECLKSIGKAINTSLNANYCELDNMVKELDDNTLEELEEALSRVKWNKKKFCEWVSCSKHTAEQTKSQPEHSVGYKLEGEMSEAGEDYGYFKYLKPLTEEQEEWVSEFTECCYYSGQPCQRNQDGTAEEDCECILGKEYYTLVLTPLGDEWGHIGADNYQLGD